MIRTLINLTTTCVVGFVLLGGGIALYNRLRAGGSTAVVGNIWNHPAVPLPSVTPTYRAGVDVVGSTDGKQARLADAIKTAATKIDAIATLTAATEAPAPPQPTPTAAVDGDCQWAISTLQEDAQLDLSASTTYPHWQSYYVTWSQHWKQIAKWLGIECTARSWSLEWCDDSRGWIKEAIYAHQHDSGGVGVPAASPAWDAQWVGYYQRIDALVGRLCT